MAEKAEIEDGCASWSSGEVFDAGMIEVVVWSLERAFSGKAT
jgi:hypothetical protein